MGFCSGNGGLCQSDADCAGQCIPVTYKPFDLVPVHGIAPGGEAFMPVWGSQAGNCGSHGVASALAIARARAAQRPQASARAVPATA